MIKKIILCLVFLALIFGGCFFITKNKKVENDKKIVFWSIQLKPIYEKQMNQIISEFEQKHKGYKIEWMDIPIDEVQKRTLASILSSTPPDLINLNPDFSVLLAQKNTLEFFNDKDLSQFHPELLEKLKYNGKIYALPFYATSAVTIYNKENYDKCFKGAKFIKTYDEMFNISSEFKNCTNIATFASSLNENETTAKILNKYDISSYSDIKQANKTKEIFSELNKMYKNSELPKDVMSISHREVIEKYMSQQANIVVAGANFIYMIQKSAPDIYKKSEISSQLTGSSGKYDISLMNLIIPKRAKNKELAFEFAMLLTNQKNQSDLAKLTNVLPANKYSLNDDYFKNCSSDLYDKSRCVSALQLNNLSKVSFSEKNKKVINETINKTLEELLLDDKTNEKDINEKTDKMIKAIKEYN